ncbi:3-phenylpropionate-dihydrodiol/cinnamic acid-dihydrodiol dehydrogenase [Leucobacter aridicollis]|uniref:SDR family NAD(P)-dependent oxidoreductase n=1 Tax=Leucobacter aridicollis TaxID=283878 RepID=UPI002166F068|nr:SDR family NAD(P)-dependent oxidoreductase [Leucobacter aridicollis]MCS3427415.1 rhamnose utilization protein RhaD (predicted bifunctional aldolase and dehydrogenase)/NAD(P)-dependent dehydrogenase (short-subunit alcohol dehydrogenase family) [Leucobacter aridicollis]
MTTELQRDLADIVRVSRELGGDPSLVLHGGGNTSIKTTGIDVTGAPVDLVLVKGSGWDLGTIEAPGFAPLRRDRLAELLSLAELDDVTMVNEMRQASLDAAAPTASIEALLHAYLPGKAVLHSHANAIVALTNSGLSDAEIVSVLGERVLVLPYIMPGFPLARLIADSDVSGVDAVVLRNHGLFTFADAADTALSRHRELVALADTHLGVSTWGNPGGTAPASGTVTELATLRRDVSRAAGTPMLVRQTRSARGAEFAARPGVAELTRRGTATPEHVIHTKRTPMIGRDVEAYAAEYRAYFERHAARVNPAVSPLHPAPRVVLDPELGLLVTGATTKELKIAGDIALHTLDVIDAADAIGTYGSLSEADSFDIEYWTLEQLKLAGKQAKPLGGEVAVVTGAASGIGRAIAELLLAQGAAVVGIDLNAAVTTLSDSDSWRGVTGDVSAPETIEAAVETAVREFGGVDMVVVAAGIFPPSQALAELDDEVWDRAFRVNVTAVARLFRAVHPVLALAPNGGRVVLVSTKNVAAPGPGVAAYSASKTAAAQLARVAALEWAADGIRVNQVEPDAVFDTAIWTPELLAARAANYGLSVEEYRTRNLLRTEVRSRTVAEAVVAFCERFPATTGAHLSVDGGNDRVI